MRWLRESSWENRASFAPLIGALSSPERFTKSQLDEVFKSVESYVNDKKLVAILVQSDAAALTMIRKYPSLIGLPRALTLLRNSDPEVRLGAIEVLKGTNDLGAMKVIINSFESEKEPSVKSKYRDTFWFVKDRK
jgi:HEAT repeat protein